MRINKAKIFYDQEFIANCISSIFDQPFWIEHENGSILLYKESSAQVYLGHVLPSLGFRNFPIGDDLVPVQVNGALVRAVDHHDIKKFVQYVLNRIPNGNLILDQMTTRYNQYFDSKILTALRIEFDREQLKDKRFSANRFYANGIVRISRNSEEVELVPYEDLEEDQFVWVDQVINRHFDPELAGQFDEDQFCSDIQDQPGHHFHKWMQNLCRRQEPNGSWTFDQQKFKSLASGFGYAIHQFWSDSKCVILLDEEMHEGEANGRTGKSVVVKDAMKAAVSTAVIDAKRMSRKRSGSSTDFMFNFVTPSTQAITFDDACEDFAFDSLFSVITGPLTVNRKYGTMFEFDEKTKPKFLLSSNHPIIGEGFSYEDRQHIVSVGNFYQFHKRELGKSPHQIHGSWLFDDDWGDDNWQEFDSFCAKALHFYLRNGLVGGGSSDTYRLNKLHASVGSPGLTSTLSRFLEEHCDMETYSHAVEGMTDDEERRSLRNYVEASHPGETFTMNQLSTGLSLVAKHYGYRLNVGLKDRPQKRFGPQKRGVNKYVITSASQPFGSMAA